MNQEIYISQENLTFLEGECKRLNSTISELIGVLIDGYRIIHSGSPQALIDKIDEERGKNERYRA